MLVDGGTAETGEEIVQHIRGEFGPTAYVNEMVLTHPDQDHASGLRTVLEQMRVDRLWINVPWEYSGLSLQRGLFARKDWVLDNLRRVIRTEYPIVDEILTLAGQKGTAVSPAVQGAKLGPFTVLSPSIDAYSYWMPQFDRTPEADYAAIAAAGFSVGVPRKQSVLARLLPSLIPEIWGNERLLEGGTTSATNESSVVLYGDIVDANERILLTGDAGQNALWASINYARATGLPLQQFSLVQIPHHGSRSNVGPSVLDALVGPKLPAAQKRFQAFVSAPLDDSSHPRKIVLNAFMRRGGEVFATRGRKLVHWGGFPPRPNYSNASYIEFENNVEAYD